MNTPTRPITESEYSQLLAASEIAKDKYEKTLYIDRDIKAAGVYGRLRAALRDTIDIYVAQHRNDFGA